MDLIEFEEQVCRLVDKFEFDNYKQNLSMIGVRHRERYIQTLQYGFDMSTAYHHLCAGMKLPEKNYYRYLNFIASRSLVVA